MAFESDFGKALPQMNYRTATADLCCLLDTLGMQDAQIVDRLENINMFNSLTGDVDENGRRLKVVLPKLLPL